MQFQLNPGFKKRVKKPMNLFWKSNFYKCKYASIWTSFLVFFFRTFDILFTRDLNRTIKLFFIGISCSVINAHQKNNKLRLCLMLKVNFFPNLHSSSFFVVSVDSNLIDEELRNYVCNFFFLRDFDQLKITKLFFFHLQTSLLQTRIVIQNLPARLFASISKWKLLTSKKYSIE